MRLKTILVVLEKSEFAENLQGPYSYNLRRSGTKLLYLAVRSKKQSEYFDPELDIADHGTDPPRCEIVPSSNGIRFDRRFRFIRNLPLSVESPSFENGTSPTGVSEAEGFTNYVGRVTSEAGNEPDGSE